MKKKKLVAILIVLLAVGFAAVSTSLILNGTIGIGANTDDFDVYFSEAVLDNEDVSSEVISSNGKTINFSTKKLLSEGEVTNLAYKVKNASTQYDAEVTVSCSLTEIAEININEYLEVKNTPDNQIIYAGKEGEGNLSIKLKNAVTEEMQVGVTCKLVVNAKERNEVGEISGSEDEIPTYSFSGILLDSEGNPLANKTLVIYPEPAIYVTTDENGYVNIPELTKEHKEIYVVENTSIEELKGKTEEEIRNIATSNTGITVSDDNITFTNGYEATNVEMQENPKGYSFYGYLRDEEDNIVPNANLVIYSETPHYVVTDGRGYFYVHGLEEGSYEIYYLTGNINDIKKLNKQEVKASAKANAEITTSTKSKKITLSNKYKINDYKIEKDEIRKYNIAFNTNGGILDIETKAVIQNREYGSLPTPTKNGYTFQGWYLNDYHITSSVLVNTDKTHTLEARWSVNSYEISFDSKGGSAVSSKLNVTYGETYGTLPTPTKEGCNFQGWYTEANGGTKIESTSKVEIISNQKLYAHWSDYKESILNGSDPVLKNELIPVKIASDGTVTYGDVKEKWYSYANKQWANAVILIDNPSKSYKVNDVIKENDIESYFVWIPRYRYQIFDEGNYTEAIEGKPTDGSIAKEIKIEFESKTVTTSKGSKKGSWLTHPSFTNFDVNGLWVGKFETSRKNNKIQIKPNVSSWRDETVKTFFTESLNYNTNLNSHMMKNTEWGAVAYLSHSKYGINTEININNNSNYLTGYAAVEGTDQSSSPGTSGTDATKTLAYNTPTGYKASTTGNITGVYDMSGGASEYVAAYMDGYGTISSSKFTVSELTTYAKYLDKYASNSTLTSFNNRILGDATGEMGPFYYYAEKDTYKRYHNNWYADHSHFVGSINPWFARGGYEYDGILAGQFDFARYTGGGYSHVGSRLVLAI